jgi:protein-S-isoprenylcysteine O-methyltransferase Ste14
MNHHSIGLIGAVVVSTIVLLGFFGVSALLFWRALPEGSHEVALVVLGGLTQMAGTAVGYWLGSSMGSAQKTAIIEGGKS